MADEEAPNQAPETGGDDDLDVVDLDELVDARVKAIMAGEGGGGGSEGGAEGDPDVIDLDELVDARVKKIMGEGGGGGSSVSAEVERILGERDHKAAHETLSKPAELPDRRGIGAGFWGRKRKAGGFLDRIGL